jgi:hypothetical protein
MSPYRDDARKATRVELVRDRCFWRVVLTSALVGDGNPNDLGLFSSRSLAESYAGSVRALFSGTTPIEQDHRAVLEDRVHTAQRELELYDETWREWGRYFDAEEAAEIRADEEQVRETLNDAQAELAALFAIETPEDVEP